MKTILILCLVGALALASGIEFDKPAELIPKHKPFADLKTGERNEVIPQAEAGNARIFNGQFAPKQKFRYQAGLVVRFGNNAYAWCGGALIGHEWILTAARCTSGAKSIEVHLGSIYSDRPQVITWGYENLLHDGWNSNGDDIALVKIPWVNYTSDISPAVLPSRSGLYQKYVHSRGVFTGWGSINDDGQRTNQLKYVFLSVMDNDDCAKYYGSSARRSSVLCTKTTGLGSPCAGDAGGPLVLENDGPLIGVATFGASTCTRGAPVGFARITFYLDWIKQTSGLYW